jgi:hypothetical protein
MYRFKCNVGGEGRPTISATASHGTVSIKDGVATTCDRKMPVAELWYQSEPGFHGVDEVMIGPPMYEAINVTVR